MYLCVCKKEWNTSCQQIWKLIIIISYFILFLVVNIMYLYFYLFTMCIPFRVTGPIIMASSIQCSVRHRPTVQPHHRSSLFYDPGSQPEVFPRIWPAAAGLIFFLKSWKVLISQVKIGKFSSNISSRKYKNKKNPCLLSSLSCAETTTGFPSWPHRGQVPSHAWLFLWWQWNAIKGNINIVILNGHGWFTMNEYLPSKCGMIIM